MAEKLLYPSEAAEILGVCLDTLRDMDKRGELTATRTEGNQRRFKTEDVERLRKQKYQHLRRKEAAVFLHVSIYTLLDMEERGILHPIKTGGQQRRYLKTELEAILDAKED